MEINYIERVCIIDFLNPVVRGFAVAEKSVVYGGEFGDLESKLFKATIRHLEVFDQFDQLDEQDIVVISQFCADIADFCSALFVASPVAWQKSMIKNSHIFNIRRKIKNLLSTKYKDKFFVSNQSTYIETIVTTIKSVV